VTNKKMRLTSASASLLAVTALAVTTGGFVAPAFAQTLALEEIVVTARQRAESIQDIPISITAFSAADIDKRGMVSMTDIALSTPGFNFENFGGSGATAPVIRGATQVAGSIEQNVSFFYDGIYLPKSRLKS
jgi:iron complex outermembrane receptor protein